MRRVVVTGLGAITPVGKDINDFWDSLTAGRHGIAPITRFDTADFKATLAAEVKDFSPADSRSKLLRDIITSINDHLEDDLNPDGIAANLYISRSQLDRIFKQNLGFTLWKYVTFKRLIRARHLLHAGIANNEVARRCGFGDYSTFYKVYTKIFDTPPRAAQPNDTTDPLLKQFYKFDETCSTMDTPGEQFQIIQRIKKLTLD